MSQVNIRREGRAGRMTLTRPEALNALSHEMSLQIEAALRSWAEDPEVALVVLDAEGDKAFCAGGDIREMYDTGRAGDYAYGRTFWRDEYRMNALMAEYPKPVVSFLNGFVMGGGVGVGCHASHRVVGESARIAMPECGIGLVPDVGGSLLLARAPGRLGAYLGLTGARMGPGDAIHAGFADHYLPEAGWEAAKAALCETGTTAPLLKAARPAPVSRLAENQDYIDALFASGTLPGIRAALSEESGDDIADRALKALETGCPLSMAATLELLERLHGEEDIRKALSLEFRFTARAMEHGDFIEGIRAQIIDRDRKPRWRHGLDVTPETVSAMLAPLEQDLTFDAP
ncbi:Enoyl-CoA hydratase/carnithine racemase [Pseudooceanicola antarcticus]|uniref:3-hydroxyisobutyryl-CoA hydrolase n=1 Tax=Pseudooceanicola antarcticus TaxID=1247613 RepID=A0A285J7H7_9RHOB|nr:enoyl-CoA hydratase/isomerase family protein [Pseudooceanicola antarcticus]PJE26931.1 enoyl-CoA hydratase/isomerase family protein [Pseudooceanicola antarcticus]SNY55807.1 Enoyl-CoA hydratase/carnithine racemase [Pseudooceanicola antarcticus]